MGVNPASDALERPRDNSLLYVLASLRAGVIAKFGVA